AVLGGVKVGLQRCPGDHERRACGAWEFDVELVELFEQVAVAVEEGSVDGGGFGEGDKDALATPGGVGSAALGQSDGAPVGLGAHRRRSGRRSMGTRRTWGMPRVTA